VTSPVLLAAPLVFCLRCGYCDHEWTPSPMCPIEGCECDGCGNISLKWGPRSEAFAVLDELGRVVRYRSWGLEPPLPSAEHVEYG
jgi:hypothetical protein